MADRWWRLSNLYTVVDEKGTVFPFVPRPVQADYYWNSWFLDIILKSRQHGFTTFKALEAMDACIFNDNYHAHLIADTRENAERLFEEKLRGPLKRFREEHPHLARFAETSEENARVLTFPNGSKLSCGMSMRGGTLQFLHISEHGKICAASRIKAQEIRSGSLNTVHAGQRICIESTAEGREGDFYEFATLAKKKHQAGTKLSPLDFKFHFYPWWKDAKNKLVPTGIEIDDAARHYFETLRVKEGIRLTPGQKAWYVVKKSTQRDLMFREHPSTPEEAFQGAVEGTYYGKDMLAVREQGRVLDYIPIEPKWPVDTSWDLGKNNRTAIWLHQWDWRLQMHRFVYFMDGVGGGLAFWWKKLQAVQERFHFTWGAHYMPHDIGVSEQSQNMGETREDFARELGLENIIVVPRVKLLADGQEAVRAFLPSCVFSAKFCDSPEHPGITYLETYRAHWDASNGKFTDEPEKDAACDGADAFRQIAQAWRPDIAQRNKKKPGGRKSWRTA